MHKKEKTDNLIYEAEEANDLESFSKKNQKLKQRLQDCQKQKEEYLAGWQRSQADFINFRHRQEEHNKILSSFAQTEIIKSLLAVLDSLDQSSNNKELSLIQQQLFKILSGYGLQYIETKNKIFDPYLHEAVQQVKSDKPYLAIVSEVQKGYTLNNQVIRPAKVKVAVNKIDN